MLTAEITEIKVKDAGEKFKGEMYIASAKLTLFEDVEVVLEQVFSEPHKSIYLIEDTMKKISARMEDVKKRYEAEQVLTIEAENEKPSMLTKLSKEISHG